MAWGPPRSPVRLLACALLMSYLTQAVPARAADPLLMFVLGFAKNLIESAIENNANKAAAPEIRRLPPAKPAAPMDESDLRILVDESFGYLSGAQRAELLAGLDKALSDPANGAYRDAILAQFVSVAQQVRFTHRQLGRLSAEEKSALADRFAANYRGLAPAQQQALVQQLRARALPLPADLNDMMLGALSVSR